MALREQKFLLVEGEDDIYTIAELMGHHTVWPKNRAEAPVTIVARGGVDRVLDEDTIPLRLKSQEVQILGVLIDANASFSKRWERVRHLTKQAFPAIPEHLPETGLVLSNEAGKRFGVWIMPDNKSGGMIETFLKLLVPSEVSTVWELAQKSVTDAKQIGAPCKDVHLDKAYLHTWLAWQDPPGDRFGTAILRKILDGNSAASMAFVKWFLELYEI